MALLFHPRTSEYDLTSCDGAVTATTPLMIARVTHRAVIAFVIAAALSNSHRFNSWRGVSKLSDMNFVPVNPIITSPAVILLSAGFAKANADRAAGSLECIAVRAYQLSLKARGDVYASLPAITVPYVVCWCFLDQSYHLLSNRG